MNKDLRNHQVQVLHKRDAAGALAVGQVFQFNSGAAYQVQEDGSLRSNKVKRTKAERKQLKRARVLDRQLSHANLCIA